MAWNTTETRSLHTDSSEGRTVAAAGQRGLSVGRSRSRNHNVCVCSFTNNDLSYTSGGATDRPKKNDAVAPSLSREETRQRATTKTGEGDSAPHKHAVAARPSTRPARGAPRVHALFKRTARRPRHTSKANNTHNKQPPKKKTLDAKESRKGLTKDPVQHRLVDRFTPSRDPPTKPRHQSERRRGTHRNTLGPPSKP